MPASPDLAATLVAMEKATLAAFQRKDRAAFTQHFGSDYVGVANDAIKTADDEVAGMMKLDLSELHLEGERVTTPAANVAIVTYTMVTKGTLGGKPIAGSIFTSTVYVQRGERWEAVLHTESMAPSG